MEIHVLGVNHAAAGERRRGHGSITPRAYSAEESTYAFVQPLHYQMLAALHRQRRPPYPKVLPSLPPSAVDRRHAPT